MPVYQVIRRGVFYVGHFYVGHALKQPVIFRNAARFPCVPR